MSEWISVEDRLPENDDAVIAAVGDYADSGIPVVPARYYQPLNTWTDIDNIDRDGDEAHLFLVTHWMPLPEPPQ